jgi:uncharacterized FAD-dependent dehydrogenase
MPGRTVVAATSEAGRVVTNGMSQYSRNERNANSGIVVGISPADYPGDALAGIEFQRRWESRAYELGGGNYNAPAQLVGDFLADRPSTSLGTVIPSYTPGITLTDLSTALPDYVVAAIREALPAFEKQIKGYAMHDAVLTGVETRTSTPVRIKRKEDYQSMNTSASVRPVKAQLCRRHLVCRGGWYRSGRSGGLSMLVQHPQLILHAACRAHLAANLKY